MRPHLRLLGCAPILALTLFALAVYAASDAQRNALGAQPAGRAPYFDRALSQDAQSSCRAAVPAAVDRISRVFPWFDEARAPQFSFYSSAAEGTPASPWAGGYYLRGRHTICVQHVPVLIEQGRLLQTMQHECVHAALALAGSSRLPLWLEEGAAILFSGEEILRAPDGSRTAKTLAELEANIQTLSAQNDRAAWEEIRAAHAQARRIAAFLANRLGAMHFVNFLRTLKNGTPFTQALPSYYALEPRELNAYL